MKWFSAFLIVGSLIATAVEAISKGMALAVCAIVLSLYLLVKRAK